MKKIITFLILLFVLFSCTGEINQTLGRGEGVLPSYWEQIKSAASQKWEAFTGWFSSSTQTVENAVETVENLRSKSLKTFEELKSAVVTAREKVEKVQKEVNQKLTDIQKAKEELLEAKKAVENLMRLSSEQHINLEGLSKEELQKMKKELEELLKPTGTTP